MADLSIHSCLSCGEPTSKPMYCSNACKVRAHRQSNPSKLLAYRRDAEERRQMVDRARVRVVVLVNRPVPQPKQPVLKGCRDCGTVVPKWKQRCPICRAQANEEAEKRSAKRAKSNPSYRVWKRISRARRRALERGSHAERFDPIEVLTRDGWRCHICGRSTPSKLRGSYDDRAPELDHIVPLAAGGEHTRLNTACACRRCNIMKSDKPLGQLRLIA